MTRTTTSWPSWPSKGVCRWWRPPVRTMRPRMGVGSPRRWLRCGPAAAWRRPTPICRPGAGAHLRSGAEMAELFQRYPRRWPTAARIGMECAFDLTLVAPRLPPFDVPPDHDENSWLRELTLRGAAHRYGTPTGEPEGLPADREGTQDHRRSAVPRLFSDRRRPGAGSAGTTRSSARDEVRRRIRRSVTPWASPRSTPCATTCSSSGSSRPSGTAHPTSTSTSNPTNGSR